MGKVILELEGNPPVKFYQFYAYPLGIILTRPEGYLWLYNNFINIYCCPDFGVETFRMKQPFYTTSIAFSSILLDVRFYDTFNIDTLAYLKFALEIKKYVYLTSDEFYNPERPTYQQTHNRHDLLLYGYDDENESFMVIGYDKTNHYRKTLFAYNDILLSEPKNIHLLSINEGYVPFLKLDIPNIVLQLKQYLNIMEQIEAYDVVKPNPLFGQDAFKYLADYIGKKTLDGDRCDMRFILMFYEHKRCMLMRMEYLQTAITADIKNIIDSYKKVVQLSEKIHLCTLKYNLTNDKRINAHIQEYFADALTHERICLLELLEKL
jgi:hypothetical protein